jgi:hypothetical protein
LEGGVVTRQDIIWLGVSAAVIGALVGGMMLGVGIALVLHGAYGGFIFIIPGAPAAGGVGWLLARRLARECP